VAIHISAATLFYKQQMKGKPGEIPFSGKVNATSSFLCKSKLRCDEKKKLTSHSKT
jgi:hypothetical protein